jgi:hypothetical protein
VELLQLGIVRVLETGVVKGGLETPLTVDQDVFVPVTFTTLDPGKPPLKLKTPTSDTKFELFLV